MLKPLRAPSACRAAACRARRRSAAPAPGASFCRGRIIVRTADQRRAGRQVPLRLEQQRARARRQLELGPERAPEQVRRQPELAPVRVLGAGVAAGAGRLARACPAVVGPLLVELWLSWLEERVFAASNVPRVTRRVIVFLPSAEVRSLPASLPTVSDISTPTCNRVGHDLANY